MTAPPGAGEELWIDASRRHMARRAATVGLLMRNSVALIVVLVTLAYPASPALPMGRQLLLVLGLWSAYRIATRSHHPLCTTIDYGLVLLVCILIPAMTPDPGFYLSNSAPQAIAGTAVISFSASVPLRVSLPLTLGIAACYGWGAAEVVGWENLPNVAALYYFALQWLTAGLIRLMVLRVASAVDEASAARRAAELDGAINDAVREYDHEQLALLHDTAASTLLVVGQGAALPRDRLVAQARRDLELLGQDPWVPPPRRMELVAVLRECAVHLATPVQFHGLQEVWLSGDVGKRVVAAAREVLNNVDRHSRAGLLRITVSPHSVQFVDDGIGFDVEQPRSGHGITDSILDRMQRAGGHASIRSTLGVGTTTDLSWSVTAPAAASAPPAVDPDRLIERIRLRYGLALVVYSLANLVFEVTHAEIMGSGRSTNALLGAIAALAVLAAVPGILFGRWQAAKPTALALIAVTIAQPILLPTDLVGGYSHWAQSSIGWCVLPLLLALPTRYGAAVLIAYWLLGAVVEIACRPQAAVLVNIGLGTASILSVQLFALLFNGLVRDAAVEAQSETRLRQRLIARDRVTSALREEYHHRYERLVDKVMELLRELSQTGTVGENLQRRARVESRRLRALFDQAATFDHPLMRQVRSMVDAAEASGVDVVIDLAGELPPLTHDEIATLVTPLTGVVEQARTSARLVVTSVPDEVSVSLVCDGIPSDSTTIAELANYRNIEVVTTSDTAWVVVHHLLAAASTSTFAATATVR